MRKLLFVIGYLLISLVQTINLQAQSNTSIFNQFPWITDNNLVQPDRCADEQIAVYQTGIYTYLLITDANGTEILYNHDGLFYCQNASNYDCVAAFKLGNPIDSWTCSPTMTTSCDLLARINFNPNLCEQCLTDISVYEYQNRAYLVYTPSNTCSDGLLQVIDCDTGAEFCLSGGIAGFRQCDAFLAGATHIQTVLEEDCREGQTNNCSVTIRNTQCRRIGIYDEADRLLTTMNPGPFGNSPVGTPTPEWTDPTPLGVNEARTYTLREGDFILARKTVTCADSEITTRNPYAAGCNDGLSIGTYTNTGCRAMTMVNTRSEILEILLPGELTTRTAINNIHILLVGNYTFDI